MITFMTTESLIHGDYPDEPLTTAVARRLRGQLAEHRMTLEDLGKVLGLSKMAASRRVNGETPISLAELELIEAATPITAAYLLTGQHSGPPPPQPPPPAVRSFHPRRQGPVRRLRPVEENGEIQVDDDAMAYLRLAGNPDDPDQKPVDELVAA